MALEYGVYRDVVLELIADLKLREVRVTGGGEKSALWNQIKADALGVRVVQISRTEGAPLGAAMLAGFGVGLIRRLDATARRWVKTASPVKPNTKRRAFYDARLDKYRGLLDALHQWRSN